MSLDPNGTEVAILNFVKYIQKMSKQEEVENNKKNYHNKMK